MGGPARAELVRVAGELRRAGIATDLAYGGKALKTALRAADAAGAKLALLLGDHELGDGVVTVRDMTSGEQVAVPLGAVAEVVRERLVADPH